MKRLSNGKRWVVTARDDDKVRTLADPIDAIAKPLEVTSDASVLP
ncbi:hypothetical protein [Spirosoma panaciterrae]|nr:hypothetical protein [Spirosoma panaciterrae]